MPYVANARMYSVTPGAATAWKALFGWLADRSGVDLVAIDHVFPAPLADLWSRPDLACGFMCGFPFATVGQAMKPIAAPVPDRGPTAGNAAYASHLIVAADSPWQTLEDTFGGRLGYTVADSHSGYNALRHHLLPYRLAVGEPLYRETVGPLYTPRRVDAVVAGEIDVGPLDSYAYELMLRHEPELGSRIRIVATTEQAPIPLLVASSACPDAIATALRGALADFGNAADTVMIRDQLVLRGFVPIAREDYRTTIEWDRQARAAGYAEPG
jgi:ABC-type phosphate/phosphonate transport system substrate-binding protein